MPKILKIILNLVTVIIILIAVLLIASTLPIPGNYQVRIVETGSMEPTILTGSIVVIKPVESYRIGDIITYKDKSRSNKPVTHRIHDMTLQDGNPEYITKGDANEDVDTNRLAQADIIGKVLFHIPYLGKVLAAVKTPVGFMLVIVVPGIIIIYDELKKVIEEIKKIMRKKQKPDNPEDQLKPEDQIKTQEIENKSVEDNLSE